MERTPNSPSAETSPKPPAQSPLNDWQRSLLARRLGQGASLLLLLYLTGVLASLLPLHLRDPGWYLSATDRLIANAPILITAACLWWLSQAFASQPPKLLKRPLSFIERLNPLKLLLLDSRTVVQRLSAGFFVLYLLVIPVELIAGSHLLLRIQVDHTTSLRELQARQALIGQRIQAAARTDDLEALLPPRARLSTGAISLSRRKQDLNRALRADQRQLLVTMTKDKEQRLTRLLTDMVRVILVSLPLALFFRAQSRSFQPIMRAVDRYIA